VTGENIKTEGHSNIANGSSWDHLEGKTTRFANTQRTHHHYFFSIFPSNIFSNLKSPPNNYGVGLF
jgi:hypothetical protein